VVNKVTEVGDKMGEMVISPVEVKELNSAVGRMEEIGEKVAKVGRGPVEAKKQSLVRPHTRRLPDSRSVVEQQRTPVQTLVQKEIVAQVAWPELSGSLHPEPMAVTDSSYLVPLASPGHAGRSPSAVVYHQTASCQSTTHKS